MPDVSSTDQSLGLHKSSRQRFQYRSNIAERKCIICNKDRYTKGQLHHLQNILLKRTVDGTYKAENKLKEYAEMHLKLKNERFIDSANRILFVLGNSSLFATDISYHKSYYESFRSPRWKRKIGNSNTTKDTINNDNPLYELFSLVQFHINDKWEIYTLA